MPTQTENIHRMDLVRAAIEKAFLQAGADCTPDSTLIDSVIFSLGLVRGTSPPPSASLLGNARKEIKAVIRCTEEACDCFDELSELTTDAMGGLDVKIAIERAQGQLKDIATWARHVKIPTPARGRPKNWRATQTAITVIEAFEKITGFSVEIANDDKPRLLEPLLREIFDILHIVGVPKAAIAAAIKEREHNNLRYSDD